MTVELRVSHDDDDFLRDRRTVEVKFEVTLEFINNIDRDTLGEQIVQQIQHANEALQREGFILDPDEWIGFRIRAKGLRPRP